MINKSVGLYNQHPPTHLTLFLFLQTVSSFDVSCLDCFPLLFASWSISVLHNICYLCLSAQLRRCTTNPPLLAAENSSYVLTHISLLVFSDVVDWKANSGHHKSKQPWKHEFDALREAVRAAGTVSSTSRTLFLSNMLNRFTDCWQ